jgi:uncharacterized membrane protein
MEAHLRKLWDSLRSSYWFVPALMTSGAVVLWAGTSMLERALYASGTLPSAWLYADDIDSVRTLLLAVAGAIIGLVGVVFSITMIPLTIATAQFGSRLLRTFLRDTGTQITLGTFVATFIFCMLVLLRLRGDPAQPLPQVSVTVGLLLALASFSVLIYFINHVAVSIQAPVVAAEVSAELHAAIDRELLHPLKRAAAPAPMRTAGGVPPDFALTARPVLATASGYVQARDDAGLLRLAMEHNLVMRLLGQPGDFVVQDTPLAFLWPGAAASEEEVDTAINTAFLLGLQRTLLQDVTFGINELVEMAVRALSPAINDPFTAMTCLDWIGTVLCRMCGRAFPPPLRCDDQGRVRLMVKALAFTDLADASFNPIREAGRANTAVTLRLLDTIMVVAQCARTEEQCATLLRHATVVARGSSIGLSEEADRQAVTARYETVARVLGMNEAGAVPQAVRAMPREPDETA